MIREGVAAVAAFAPLPVEDDCTVEVLDALQEALERVVLPVNKDEADALLALLDAPDESTYFGLMFAVRRAIESLPSWPPDGLWRRDGPWVRQMQELARASGIEPPV